MSICEGNLFKQLTIRKLPAIVFSLPSLPMALTIGEVSPK